MMVFPRFCLELPQYKCIYNNEDVEMCAPSPLCSDFPPAPPDFPPVFPDFDDPPNPPSINVPTFSSYYGGWPEQLFSGRFIETYEGCAEVSYP